MSDEVETFVYTGEPAWHGLGESWTGNLSPKQVLKKGRLDWEVIKVPAFAEINGKQVYIGHDALVRKSDNRMLDVVTTDWNTVQNKTAFEFFDEFCEEGKMKMETAGSLKNGQIVFGLARIQDSFELFRGKDKIDSFLLFTNPHKYGWSTSVSFTPIRVVCWNTLNLSLNTTKGDKIVKISHRREFVAEQVKEALGISKEKLVKYKEMAEFLAAKKAKAEDVVTYFKRIFPVLTQKEDSTKEMSKSAKTCLAVVETQPGAEFSNGTWWNAANAVTFFTDHIAARTQDATGFSWYGTNRKLKVKALETAVEMASAS